MTILALAAIVFVGVLALAVGFIVGYVVGHRAAARQFQRGFPIQPSAQKSGSGLEPESSAPQLHNVTIRKGE